GVVVCAEIDVDAGSLVGSLGQREEGDWGDDGAAGVDLVIQQDRARLAVGGGDLEVSSILERAAIDDVEAIDWNRNAQAEAADCDVVVGQIGRDIVAAHAGTAGIIQTAG